MTPEQQNDIFLSSRDDTIRALHTQIGQLRVEIALMKERVTELEAAGTTVVAANKKGK